MGSDTFVDRRTFLRSAGAAGGVLALTGVGSAQEAPDRYEMLVGVSSAADMGEVESAMPSRGEVVHRNETLRYMTVAMDSESSWADRVEVESQLADMDGVRYVEENRTYEAFEVASDDVEAALEANDPRLSDQYAPQQVNAPAAWDTTLGSDGVTIGIVDTGVDYEHPDLRDRFPEDPGRDFVDDDEDPAPENGFLFEENHGTHVAGIASATTNNGEGVAGVSNSTLISARALGTRGSGSIDGIADAVQYVTDRGADVINMSLGGGGPSDTLQNAVSYAADNDALVIAAAGNSGQEEKQYPAGFEEVVAVSAVDDSETLASFSTYGDHVEVTAPGVDVLSTWPQDTQYNRISGTSMSCPVATGVAALGKAAYPDLSATELRNRLTETATDIGLPENEQGAGQVDAAAIVEGGTGGGGGGENAPVPEMVVDSQPLSTGQPAEFDGSLSFAFNGVIESHEWRLGDGTTKSGATVEHAYADPGEYTVTLTVTDSEGASASTSQTVSVNGDPVQDPGGSCGDTVETTTESGSLAGAGDTASFVYEAQTAEPCDVTVSLSGGQGTDYDLYLTHDGSTPTATSYDQRSWTFGSDEEIEVDDQALAADAELGIMVSSYSGGGEYDLTIEESGTGAGGGGGGGGSDPGDPGEPGEPGDPGGPGEPGGSCEAARATDTMSGRLDATFGEATFVYDAQLADPCQVTISLSGPANADFDAFVTEDGSEPGSFNYDHASTTPDSNEQVTVSDPTAGQSLGIMVQSWDGTGDFEVTVEELGRR